MEIRLNQKPLEEYLNFINELLDEGHAPELFENISDLKPDQLAQFITLHDHSILTITPHPSLALQDCVYKYLETLHNQQTSNNTSK